MFETPANCLEVIEKRVNLKVAQTFLSARAGRNACPTMGPPPSAIVAVRINRTPATLGGRRQRQRRVPMPHCRGS